MEKRIIWVRECHAEPAHKTFVYTAYQDLQAACIYCAVWKAIEIIQDSEEVKWQPY